MVENGKFLNRLRNGHLEKSAVTGLFYPSRSLKTAKTPTKVYLRLRFQNLGKPRTAGLCGRAARISDCGPLSCYIFERANKGRQPPEQGMTGRETPIPKGAVSHRRSRIHRALSHIAHKRRNVRFKGLRRVHTPPQPLTAHTAAHRAKHGAFFMGGWYHYPRSVLRGLGTLRGRVSERHTLPLSGLGRGESRRTQRVCGTAMRLCASLLRGVAAPLGCVIPLLFLSPH